MEEEELRLNGRFVAGGLYKRVSKKHRLLRLLSRVTQGLRQGKSIRHIIIA
jgi:hypothetical protein